MQQGLISITRAAANDAEALTALSVTTFIDAFAADNRKEDMDKYIAEELNIAKISAELSDEENKFFLLHYDRTLVAYAKMCATKIPEKLRGRRAVELERIYVLQDYQAKKIGAALMDYCLEYAVANGYDVLWLGVWRDNHKAINFYKRYGFEFFGSHTFRLGDDLQTDELMMKEL